tara:strand:- start:108 stop:401 length:294 start_codon:yes stop_codon:yes gene_type:complete
MPAKKLTIQSIESIMVHALRQIEATENASTITRDTIHNTVVSREDARPDGLSTAALYRSMVNTTFDHYEDTTPIWPTEPDWIGQDIKAVAPKLFASI